MTDVATPTPQPWEDVPKRLTPTVHMSEHDRRHYATVEGELLERLRAVRNDAEASRPEVLKFALKYAADHITASLEALQAMDDLDDSHNIHPFGYQGADPG